MAWAEVIIVWFLCGIIAGTIGEWRRVGFVLHFLIGILFGPIGILTAFLFRPTDEERYRSDGTSSGLTKCPYCAEYVKVEARICKHCRSELPAGFARTEFSPSGPEAAKSAETEIYRLYQIIKYPDHCTVEKERFDTVEDAKKWIDETK